MALLSALLWGQSLSSLKGQDHRGVRESWSSSRSTKEPQPCKQGDTGWGQGGINHLLAGGGYQAQGSPLSN